MNETIFAVFLKIQKILTVKACIVVQNVGTTNTTQ